MKGPIQKYLTDENPFLRLVAKQLSPQDYSVFVSDGLIMGKNIYLEVEIFLENTKHFFAIRKFGEHFTLYRDGKLCSFETVSDLIQGINKEVYHG